MKNKTIVILFPEREYLGTRANCIPLYNECIQKRYLDKEFELLVVRYRGYRPMSTYSGGIIDLPVDRMVEADITSSEQLTQYANFEKLANEITQKKYEKIVVGGFHCFDCVEKLAKEIYVLNKNVIIDTDLTDHFNFVSKYYKDWNISKFQPELKFDDYKRRSKYYSEDLLDRMINKYKHPIWGISKEYIELLKKETVQKNQSEQNAEV